MAAGGEELSFLPPSLRQRLMPFQRDGVKFAIEKQGRCLIGDEMGLGKTIQAIAVAYYYKAEWPVLIVVPSSLKYPWVEELEKWLPELQPNDINMISSSTDTSGIPTSKISILSYGLLRNEYQTLLQALTDQNFQVVIVDESHYIKNLKTSRTKLLLPVLQNSRRTVLLTGTPALSRPAELFPQVKALQSNLFGSWTAYAKKYCNAQWRHFGRHRSWDTGGASNLPELHSMLKQHIMIRREKKQVLSELPAKRRQKIPFVLNDTPQKKEVDRLLDELWKVVKGELVLDEGVHPKTVINGLISTLYTKTAAAKAGAVRDYIKTLLDNQDQKFLVFAHHHLMLQVLTETVLDYNKEHHAKIKFIRIDGTVPGAERARLVKQFQTDDNVKVAILSILAAGTGLTFTAATQVVFAELHWTPGVMDQCEDRAHRIGQKSSIQVHYLVARGTIDDFMWSAITKKVSVVSHALSGQLRHLNVGECDKEDVEFLSHAAAWLPGNQEDGEDDEDDYYFSSQSESKQPSILNFFTPKNNSSPRKRKTKRIRQDSQQSSRNTTPIIRIDSSDDDDDDFRSQPIRKKSRASDGSQQPMRTALFGHVAQSSQSKVSSGRNLNNDSGCDSDLPEVFSTPSQTSFRSSKEEFATKEKLRCWSCTACTFENHNDLPFCEICDTPRKLEMNRRTRNGKVQPQTSQATDSDDVSTKSGDVYTKNGDVNTERDDVSTKTGDVKTETDDEMQTAGGDAENSVDSDDTIVDYYTTRNSDITTDIDDASHHVDTASQKNGESSSSAIKRNRPLDETRFSEDVNSDVPIYEKFHFCASRYTDRIYLYDRNKCPLAVSFTPIDVQQNDRDNLPELLHQPSNMKLVKRFVRVWNSLHEMKKRLVRKSGQIFFSVFEIINDLKTKSQTEGSSKKRYLTKADLAQTAIEKASAIGGSTRVIRRHALTPEYKRSRNQNTRKRTPREKRTGKEEHEMDSREMKEIMELAGMEDGWTDDEGVNGSNSGVMDTSGQSRGFLSGNSWNVDPRKSAWNTTWNNERESSGSESPSGSPFGLSSQRRNAGRRSWCGRKSELCEDGIGTPSMGGKTQDGLDSTTAKILSSKRDEEPTVRGKCVEKQNDSTRHGETFTHVGKTKSTPKVPETREILDVCKTGDASPDWPGSSHETDSEPNQGDTIYNYFTNTKDTPRRKIRNWEKPVLNKVTKTQKANPVEGNDDNLRTTGVGGICAKKVKKEGTEIEQIQGSLQASDVVVISESDSLAEDTVDTDTATDKSLKYKRPNRVQVVDAEGCPLCLYCGEPCRIDQTKPSTSNKNIDWDTRYCSEKCKEDHYIRAKGGYVREQLSEIEHGKCQICGIDAHELYLSVKSRPKKERKDFLAGTKFSKLPIKVRNNIIEKPSEGKFWQADHIIPVSEGGGLCSLENFRTLCTVCHRAITDVQSKQRNKDKKIQARRSAGFADITKFFKPP